MKTSSTHTPPSWSLLAMMSAVVVVFSAVPGLAFKPQMPIHTNRRAGLNRDTVMGSAMVNSKNVCSVGNNNGRRVRCSTRGLVVGQSGFHGSLPLAAASSSEEGTPAKKKRKSKTKSKSKAKRKAKAKAKAKTKRKAKEEQVAVVETLSAPEGKESSPKALIPDTETSVDSSDDGVETIHVSSMPKIVYRDSGHVTHPEPYLGPEPKIPDAFQFDLTGGRPGTIIESEAELEEKEQIMKEVEINDESVTGRTQYPKWLKSDYGFLQEDEDAEYDNDDPDAIDGSTLGDYDITDLNTKFDWEWDPETDDDPNLLETQTKNEILPTGRFVTETEKDEEGIEVGFDSLFGVSNPIDERTKIGTVDSYMVDENTRNEEMLTPEFSPDDPEKAYNEDIVQYRKSLDIIETYQDEFLPETMPVPRNVAKWYGYPEKLSFPPKNYTNNRFTKPEDLTNFDEMTPFRARQRAVELARANNAEWMPDGVSQAWHQEQRRPYEEQQTLIGSLRKGDCDPEIVEMIKPALKVLGSSAELLSIEGEENTVFRFHYHGLMKNKYGMSCWTETLIRDCGVDVTGVVFETGFRARDPAYDGGFPYHGWE